MNNFSQINPINEKKVIDVSLKLVLVFILVAWCGMIILPFVTVLLWSIILAITLFPVFTGISGMVKGKKAISATIVCLIMLILLLIPFIFLLSAIYDEAKEIGTAFKNDTLTIPPPNPKVADWPLIGPKLYAAWSSLNSDLEATVLQYKDQLKSLGQKIVQSIMGLVSTVLMFSASIIIAGVFMATSGKAEKSTLRLFTKLAGDNGAELMVTVIQTVRNVAKGIIGVAFIQFVLMGTVFVLADVPLAGFLALIVLFLALVQLPSAIVAVPVMVYVFSVKEPLPATFWSIILILVGLSDNVLKPWLMGKGAPVPMLVIFLGSVGGFILSGFIGLFTGAIILSIGYKLGVAWLEGTGDMSQEEADLEKLK